jgi:hypothetical protein
MEATTWHLLREACLRGLCEGDATCAEELVALGYARMTPRGIAPTTGGRDALEQWARLEEGSEAHAAARRAYDAFLPLDLELKQLATDWQACGAAKKPALDTDGWKCIDRLTSIDERMGPPLRRIGEHVPRFASYRPRLRDARTRLEDGQLEYFTGLLVDSYHTVWWHLHQDMLWALGISRADDPNQ